MSVTALDASTGQKAPLPERDAYTARETAERLGGISYHSVLDLIKTGRLRATRVGKSYIIGKRDIDTFLYGDSDSLAS